MKITKKITVSTDITSDDLGLTFANSMASDQSDFLSKVVSEFNLFDSDGGSRDLQLEHIATEVTHRNIDNSAEILKWLTDLADKISYHLEIGDVNDDE